MLPVPHPSEYDFGSPEDKLVEDVLSADFWKVWNETAINNQAAFERIFRPVPTNQVRNWKDYDSWLAPTKAALVSSRPLQTNSRSPVCLQVRPCRRQDNVAAGRQANAGPRSRSPRPGTPRVPERGQGDEQERRHRGRVSRGLFRGFLSLTVPFSNTVTLPVCEYGINERLFEKLTPVCRPVAEIPFAARPLAIACSNYSRTTNLKLQHF